MRKALEYKSQRALNKLGQSETKDLGELLALRADYQEGLKAIQMVDEIIETHDQGEDDGR
jgi:hypothetical protein